MSHKVIGLILALVFVLSYAPEASAISTEDTPVFRVQFQISLDRLTGDGGDDVEVRLNGNNSTWLYTGSPIKPNFSPIFDLTLDNVETLSDISVLWINKLGNDHWYVKSVRLRVNDRTIFDKGFYEPLLLSGNATYLIPSVELRNDYWWRLYTFPGPPSVISDSSLRAQIEGIVGDYLVDNMWKGWSSATLMWRYPEIETLGASRSVFVSLSLKSMATASISVRFNIEFSCGAGKIFLNTRNLNMDYPVVDSASMNNKTMLQTFIQLALPATLQRNLQRVTYTNALGQPACPTISIDNYGSIFFRN